MVGARESSACLLAVSMSASAACVISLTNGNFTTNSAPPSRDFAVSLDPSVVHLNQSLDERQSHCQSSVRPNRTSM